MTVEDANYLLGLAQANFGYAFRNMTDQQKIMLVHSWAFGLQDIPADIVMMAFMQLTTSCDWLPNVAKIREQVRKLRIEAKERASREEDIRRLFELTGRELPPKQDGRDDRIRQYIIDHTETLDKGVGLELDTILSGTYATPIGSGQMGFSGYLPPENGREY